MELIIRVVRDTDNAFIQDSWCKELKRQIPHTFEELKNYNKRMSSNILEALAKCKVLIACSDEDEDQIFGWVAFTDERIHFMYVKSAFRGNGLGSALLEKVAPQFGKRVHIISCLPRYESERELKMVDWLKANKLIYKALF